MKDVLIAVCTPDTENPAARRCLAALMATRLDRAELVIADNRRDPAFSHPVTMDLLSRVAAGRPMVFMDDDVIVEEPDWLDLLLAEAKANGAAVVGAVHAYESGEVNHTGILVHADCTTRLMRERPEGAVETPFAPAVSSALVLVKEPDRLKFDTSYRKYQHDTDVCLAAWKGGCRVVCARGLTVTHAIGGTMGGAAGFRAVYAGDAARLKKKWGAYVASGLYDLPELAPYREAASLRNYEAEYNRAALLMESDRADAVRAFGEFLASGAPASMLGSAHYHLYGLTGDAAHLTACVALYPGHAVARAELERLGGKGAG